MRCQPISPRRTMKDISIIFPQKLSGKLNKRMRRNCSGIFYWNGIDLQHVPFGGIIPLPNQSESHQIWTKASAIATGGKLRFRASVLNIMSTKMTPKARIQRERSRKDLHTRSPRSPLTLWEKIDELNAPIPASEWSKLPKDGSVNVDHYLYGSPILY
jgi:hypothetical protein